MISYIWAQSKNGVIGNNGKVPWNMPADMHHFVQVTKGHAILAGRKTFDSFPRPLPHRKNMVLTKHSKKDFPKNVFVFNTYQNFLKYAREHYTQQIIVVGGASLYKLFRPFVDCLHKTVIDHNFKGDTKFPKFDYSHFRLVNKEDHPADKKNHYSYHFYKYLRHLTKSEFVERFL